MNNLMIFENRQVEVFELDGKVLFNPGHVAACLEIKDVNSVIRGFNGNQKIKLTNSDMHNMHIRKLNNAGENFLTESGVYKLIFKSRKAEAEKFQDWVTDEVLPQIRKTGSYKKVDSYMIDDPVERARVWIGEYEEKKILTKNLLAQKEILQGYKPKIEIYDEWIEINNLSTATVLAKAFGFKSTVQFNRELELRGIQYKKGGCWHLRAEYSGLGYTAYRSHEIQHSSEIKNHDVMYWTNSGKEFIKNILSKTVIPVAVYNQIQF